MPRSTTASELLGVFQPSVCALLQPTGGLITTKLFRVRHLRWLGIKETPACTFPPTVFDNRPLEITYFLAAAQSA
jgi:hypothetical protein